MIDARPTCRAAAVVCAMALFSACAEPSRPGSEPAVPESDSAVVAAPTRPSPGAIEIEAEYSTVRLANDPDDPAIWLHPTDPSKSLILGTMKVAAPAGALVVFGVDGQIREVHAGIERPNNVDVEYGLIVDGIAIDIAVVTERYARRLRMFRIARDGSGLTDIGAIPVLQGAEGESGVPMGVALYKRPRDGAIFAIVSPKEGPRENYLWQYRLTDAFGRVAASPVRRFGRFSGRTPERENEIEAIAVDDDLGFVYYADEHDGIHKYHADPDQPDAAHELAVFATTGFRGDREGIAIYARPDGTGYILCTDQIPGSSEYHVFKREGEPGRPHDHSQRVAVLAGGADATDGLEVTSRELGPGLPRGAMVAMSSVTQNFLIFRWQDIEEALAAPRPTALTP